MRYLIANRKMHKTRDEVVSWCDAFKKQLPASPSDIQIVLAVPFVYIQRCVVFFASCEQVAIAAQDCSHIAYGARSGEVSARMLASLGVRYVLVGHSEVRINRGLTTVMISDQLQLVHECGMVPVYCFGEQERVGNIATVIGQQLDKELGGLDSCKEMVWAYEPRWAISAHVQEPLSQVELMAHVQQVCSCVTEWSEAQGYTIPPLLYGGSVKPSNVGAWDMVACLDGYLVGGASLHSDNFKKMCLTDRH